MFGNEQRLTENEHLLNMKIIKSISEDAAVLTKLTLASKSYWNYSTLQLEEWKEDLTITETYIYEYEVYKLILSDEIAGYYSFIISAETIEFDNLFVHPKHIGTKLGSTLILHFLENTKNYAPRKIVLYSDPNAELFYKKFGFKTVGQKATSDVNRFLPIMEKENKQ